MTKLHKKLMCAMLAATMFTGLLAGCSPAEKPADKPVEKPADKPAEKPAEESKPVEFSYMGSIWGDHPQDGNPIFDEMMKRSNTAIDFSWFPSASYEEKVSVTLASGKIPDVIYGASIPSLVEQGAIIPLDDLLEEHGQNILAAIGEEDLKYVKQATDGKIYHIPTVLDYPPAYAMQIRQDWLTNVGIEKTPETWDEWKAAWKAFKEQDANKDGDATNEVPYGGDIYSLMPAFGMNVADKYGFLEDKDGNYTLAYELPEFRVFLEEMRTLYKEGILDKEFSTRGTFIPGKTPDLEQAFQANIVGSGMTWAANTRTTTEVLREIDPNATLIGVKPIVGPNGAQGIPQRKRVSGSAAISIAAEDKAVDIIKFFDYLFSEEGTDLMSFGIEGTHHKNENGELQLIAPYNTGFKEAREAGLNFTPFPHVFAGSAYEQLTLGGKTVEELPEPMKIFYDALVVGEDSFFVSTPILSTEAYAEKQAMVFPKIESLLAECVIGKISVDQFYTEYEKLKPVGLQDILTQGNEAWQKLK